MAKSNNRLLDRLQATERELVSLKQSLVLSTEALRLSLKFSEDRFRLLSNRVLLLEQGLKRVLAILSRRGQ